MMGVVRSQTAANRFSENSSSSLKKIRSKNFHFFWSKKYYFFKSWFPFFSKKACFFEKIKFLSTKSINFTKEKLILLTFFLKYFFDQKKIIFFVRIFFKVHLLVEENEFKAISERFRQFKAEKNQGKKVFNRN